MNQGIITKHTANIKGNSFSVSGAIDSSHLRRYLLYWDKIIYPQINGFGPNLDSLSDLRFLNENKILSIEEISISPDLVVPQGYQAKMGSMGGIPFELLPNALSHAQLNIAEKRLDAGEIWSIAQIGDEAQLPQSTGVSPYGLVFQLYNCLPTPREDVSLGDIIDFRINNKSQLNQLHGRIESFRKEILLSPDPKRDLIIIQKELNEAINEVASLIGSKSWGINYESIKSYLQVPPNSLTTYALGGLGVMGAEGLTIPPAVGLAAAYAVNLGINIIGRELVGHQNLPEQIKDYVFVYNSLKENIAKS